MPTDRFFDYDSLKKYECRSAKVRKQLLKDAIRKNEDKHNGSDSNLLFPRTVLENVLIGNNNKEPVGQVLECQCRICKGKRNVLDPQNDPTLIQTISNKPDCLRSLAILIWMGASFAMRFLMDNGIGQEGFNVDDVLKVENNSRDCFKHLRRGTNEYSDSNDAYIAQNFINCFKATWPLFNPPNFGKDNIMKRELWNNCNLPFLFVGNREGELPDRQTSSARLYKFSIHRDYCPEDLLEKVLVRKELRVERDIFSLELSNLDFIKKSQHDNLIKLHFWYKNEGLFNLVFTYYRYDLQDVLRNQPERLTLSPNKMKGTFKGSKLDHWLWENLEGVIKGLEFIHNPTEELIGAHFDLKPANILVDEDGKLIITDFGLAIIRGQDPRQSSFTKGYPGTLAYQPPDSRDVAPNDTGDRQRWSRAYDIWSLGCIMTEVIIYILEGAVGPKTLTDFDEELTKEDEPNKRHKQFWKLDSDSGSPAVKKCVLGILDKAEKEDQYLQRTVKSLKEMLSIKHSGRPTVNKLYETLYSSHATDGLSFRDGDYFQLCEAQTSKPLGKMTITVVQDSTEAECELDRIECQGQGGRINVYLNNRNNGHKHSEGQPCQTEELIPVGSFNIMSDAGFLCGFRHVHRKKSFQFADRSDYFHFQAAVTRQLVFQDSTSSINACCFELKTHWFWMKKPLVELYERGLGQVQIWREVGDEEHKRVYVNELTPVTYAHQELLRSQTLSDKVLQKGVLNNPSNVPLGRRTGTSISSGNTSIREEQLSKDVHRLVVFLPGTENHYLTIVLTGGKAQLLSRSKWMEKQKEMIKRRPRLRLEKRAIQEYFPVGHFHPERVGFNEKTYAGIPLDTNEIRKHENGKDKLKMSWLELEFENEDGYTRFVNVYDRIFPGMRETVE